MDKDAANKARENGIYFSNGNYAIRHLGIPSSTVPVALTLAGPDHADSRIPGWGIEQAGTLCTTLPPELSDDSDWVDSAVEPQPNALGVETSGRFDPEKYDESTRLVLLEGTFNAREETDVRLTVNGEPKVVLLRELGRRQRIANQLKMIRHVDIRW